MDLDRLQQKLLQAARQLPLDEAVPYAFEQRIMARLAQLNPHASIPLLDRILWRAAGASLAVALLFGVWCFYSDTNPSNTPVTLESTVLSMAKQMSDSW